MTFSELKALERPREIEEEAIRQEFRADPHAYRRWLQFGQLLDCLASYRLFVYRTKKYDESRLELRSCDGTPIDSLCLSSELFFQLAHTPKEFIDLFRNGEGLSQTWEILGWKFFDMPCPFRPRPDGHQQRHPHESFTVDGTEK